jgi:1-acyl-sn-glycerol-3-phosphate acyltransferase
LLFVSNHRSFSDGFLMALLPEHGVQIVNLWPFRIPILGFFARGAGYLSIREMPFDEFVQRAGKLLEEGASIACFPEGTRSGSRRMGPFHGSVFRLALQSKTPIVPLCISGNESIPARGSLVLHPGIITVQRLQPIHPEQHQDLSAFQFKTKVRATMARELAAMDGVPPEEGEAGEPSEPPPGPDEAGSGRSGSPTQA